jgi:murein L,D-transpeptidase YafK
MVGNRVRGVRDLALVFGAALACAPAGPRVPAALPPPVLAESAAEPLARIAEPAVCERILAIAVSKRDRRLRAACEGGAQVEMVVALGRGAAGPKLHTGDSRTPEGQYRIGAARPSRFHQFIPFDYPSLSDAETARAQGRLSDADYRRIAAAHEHGESPPADTALGGFLGLHGEGERWRGDSRLLDWTLGCIALSDADVDFIAARSAEGTPLSIVP